MENDDNTNHDKFFCPQLPSSLNSVSPSLDYISSYSFLLCFQRLFIFICCPICLPSPLLKVDYFNYGLPFLSLLQSAPKDFPQTLCESGISIQCCSPSLRESHTPKFNMITILELGSKTFDLFSRLRLSYPYLGELRSFLNFCNT